MSIIQKHTFVIILSFLSFGFIGCKDVAQTTENQEIVTQQDSSVLLTDAQKKQVNIHTGFMEKMKMGGMITMNGKAEVTPQNLVTISAPLGGYIKSIKLISGMKVQKGQVIAVLENKEFIQIQQDYLLAKSSLYFAEKELNRQQELNKSQSTSDKILQQADEIVRTKRIEIRSLEEKLRLININPSVVSNESISAKANVYAPITGYIASIGVNTGKYVQPSDMILEIMDTKTPLIILKAFEKDIPDLEIGNAVTVFSNNQPDIKMKGKIIFIGKDIKAEGYTEVMVALDNPSKEIVPGLYVSGEVASASSLKDVLPEEAVISFEGDHYLFLENSKGGFDMQKVDLGISEAGNVEVKNIVNYQNQKIVIKGAYTLLMKKKNVSE